MENNQCHFNQQGISVERRGNRRRGCWFYEVIQALGKADIKVGGWGSKPAQEARLRREARSDRQLWQGQRGKVS